MEPYIAIQEDDVDINDLIRRAKMPGTGAVVVFDGIVRDDDIDRMELEAYEPVARKLMTEIARKGGEQHGLLSVAIVHRVGSLSLGENILIVVVGAGHRKEAFAGAVAVLDEVKAKIPIWKKEHLRGGGTSWVEGNAEGLPPR